MTDITLVSIGRPDGTFTIRAVPNPWVETHGYNIGRSYGAFYSTEMPFYETRYLRAR
jgi:hypothetical protein